MINTEFDITARDSHEPGFNARGGFGQKTRKRKRRKGKMRTDYICGKGGSQMIRVSKPTAKKAYKNGKKVHCAMIYDRVSGYLDTFEVVGDFEMFESEVIYYNSCKERGNYLKFYVEK